MRISNLQLNQENLGRQGAGSVSPRPPGPSTALGPSEMAFWPGADGKPSSDGFPFSSQGALSALGFFK